MSVAAHTPGPWGKGNTGPDQIMLLGKNGEGNYVCHIQIVQSGGGDIARCMEGQRAANARLIAAAPDLLECLTEWAGGPCETAGVEDMEAGCCRSCRARAAIAKATAA